MLIDSKGKLFGKISIVDILILAVILIFVAFMGMKYIKAGAATPFTNKDKIEIAFYGNEVFDYAANSVKKGDIVKDSVRNSVFGTVTEVSVEESKSYASDSSGKYATSPKEGYKSIYITVEGEGLYSDAGVEFDSSSYYVGRSIDLNVGNSSFTAKISSVKKD